MPPTMTAGTHAGFIAKDYTPADETSGRLRALLTAFTRQGCVATPASCTSLADGHGRAVITSRLFEPALHAFDSMFSESAPSPAPPNRSCLRRATASSSSIFGARVRHRVDEARQDADGVVRTTVVEFDDITRLRLMFPPVFGVPSGATVGMRVGGLTDPPVIRFAMKPHENGDRVLLVRLPDETLPSPPDPGRDPEITVFATGSREEQLFKRGVKGAALRVAVELDDEIPLLRTNAPVQSANTATIRRYRSRQADRSTSMRRRRAA